MLKTEAHAVHESLKACPFCQKQLTANIRGAGENAPNPKASCKTEGCWGGRLPTLCLDVPEDVAAWNHRAESLALAIDEEARRDLVAAMGLLKGHGYSGSAAAIHRVLFAAPVVQQWPTTRAETLMHVIQCLNQNPYNLTKSECITLIQEMRAKAEREAGAQSATHTAAPALINALQQAEAGLEVAIARIQKADPNHSIEATSEALALAAVRAALSAQADQVPAGHYVSMSGEVKKDISVYSAKAAPAPVALPEPDAAIAEIMELVRSCVDRAVTMHTVPTLGINTIESKLTTLLAGVSAPAGETPAAWQFQDRDGVWCFFMNERHRQETIKDGTWPIRALYTAPVAQAIDIAELVTGMSVSVDVSTGDDDAGNRYFGTVTVAQEDLHDKHGLTLLVQDAKPNFTAPAASEQDALTAPDGFEQVWLVCKHPLWPQPMECRSFQEAHGVLEHDPHPSAFLVRKLVGGRLEFHGEQINALAVKVAQQVGAA